MKKVLELQLNLWGGSCNLKNLSHIVCCSFLFWTLYKQGGVVIKFHIKKFTHVGWVNQKVEAKTKKQIMHISKMFTFPSYLST